MTRRGTTTNGRRARTTLLRVRCDASDAVMAEPLDLPLFVVGTPADEQERAKHPPPSPPGLCRPPAATLAPIHRLGRARDPLGLGANDARTGRRRAGRPRGRWRVGDALWR